MRDTYFKMYNSPSIHEWQERKSNWYPLSLDINYRNKYMKTGISTNFLLLKSIRYKQSVNLLMHEENTTNLYLGPYYSIGYFFNDDYLSGVKGVHNFGMEAYIKNFHIDLGYSFYIIRKNYQDHYKNGISGWTFNLGYAINLKTFK